ncbi:MAG: major capsid protein [Jiangellaceae bacterium]
MPFEIPEDLTALDDAALAEAIEQALTEAGDFADVPDAELDDEKLNRLIALADFATAAKAEQGTRDEVAAERATRAQAARAALARPEVEEVVDAEIVEDEPAAEEKKEPAAVAASAARKVPVVARVAKVNLPVDVTPNRPTAVLTASADVPGFPTGGAIEDLDGIGKALVSRMKGLPTTRLGGEQGVQQRYSVAQIDLGANRTDDLVQTNTSNDQQLVTAAAKEHRLPGGSLTAAGGWCAPSETLYDLCVTESTDGLLDLPSITVNRGGIRYTKGPSFSDIYNTAGLGWNLTEAQVIAGTPAKTCIEVTCPPFSEVRLDAVGICIKAPLLTLSAYPELVRRFTEGALIAQQHKQDVALLSKIAAGSTPLNVNGVATSTIDSLGELEMLANYQRQQWRSSWSQTFEVLLPAWYKTTVRADLARRTGIDLINVTDQVIESYFTARKLRAQFLANYQPLTVNTGAVVVPSTVEALIFPAGTWVKGTTDVISLDAVYDSTTLLTNEYTALFAESGVLVVNTCWDSIKATISTCASGRTGIADVTACAFG